MKRAPPRLLLQRSEHRILSLPNGWAAVARLIPQDEPRGVARVVPEDEVRVQAPEEVRLLPWLGGQLLSLPGDPCVIGDRTEEAASEGARQAISTQRLQARHEALDDLDRMATRGGLDPQRVETEEAVTPRLPRRAV
jgi:hypothetical protein